MKILLSFFSIIVLPFLVYFLGLQLLYFAEWYKSGFIGQFTIGFDFTKYLEYPQFLWLITLICLLEIFSFSHTIFFSKNARKKRKALTGEERKRMSRLATTREAKRGLQRLEFNSKGENLQNNTIRGYFDVLLNPLKKKYNSFISFIKADDSWKVNTLKTWEIDGRKTNRRGGYPIITKKRKVWLDAADVHALVAGTTRSGKTFGFISPLIQFLRMGGESMIVMDVKGELYANHGQSLKEDGYEVQVIDFINPKKSVKYNPFGIVIKKYREAYANYQEKLNQKEEDIRKAMMYTNIIRDLQMDLEDDPENKEIKIDISMLQKKLEVLFETLPQPNYSEAQELCADVARRLYFEPGSKEPFWTETSGTMLEGYINFLLEEKTKDEQGEYQFLDDEQINMYSVKMLHSLGKTPLRARDFNGCKTVLEFYLKKYRKSTDVSYLRLLEYVQAPENTKGSLSSVFDSKLKYYLLNQDILDMTSESELDLKDLGRKKKAIFISVHDEKNTYHTIASMLISQTYEELIKEARMHENLRLKVPVTVVWDEFANGAAWENITNALTAGLSRGIRFCLVVQDYNQLKMLYGEKAETIKSNCQDQIFLLAGEYKTLEDVSRLCGTKKVWDENRQDKVDVPVVSTDMLQHLSVGDAIVIRQRMNPYRTRYLGIDSYGFCLPKTIIAEEREEKKLRYFDILSAFQERRRKEELESKAKEEKKEEIEANEWANQEN